MANSKYGKLKDNKKIIVLGLDGATWNILYPWVTEGELPTLKKIVENGVSANLKSTIPCQTSVALPAFYTGKNPGKTGIFGFTKSDGSVVGFNDIKENVFWDHGDIKSCIVDLRMTYPPRKTTGILVSGDLPTPSESSDYTYPPSIKDTIKGFHAANDKLHELGKNPKKNKDELYHLALETTMFRYEAYKKLIQFDDFDFSIFWIGNVDFIQHWFWDDKETILNFYKEMDDILSDIIRTNENANIFIMSDHGFESYPEYYFNANSWLRDNNYLTQKSKILSKIQNVVQPLAIKYIDHRILLNLIYIKNKHFNSTKIVDSIEKPFTNISGIDSKRSVAYLDHNWGIEILKENLECDYEALREELIGKLQLIKYNNIPIFRNIYKKEEVFSGKYLDQIPDIIFLLDAKFKAIYTMSNKHFQKTVKTNYVGTHDYARNGIFIAYGPDIKNAHRCEEFNILDLAPTILHMFDTSIPEDMDGRVLKEIFEETSEYFLRDEVYQTTNEIQKLRNKVRMVKRVGKI